MYLARESSEALVLALLSMCCWGSWTNTMVYCGDKLRFELFYVDYAIGVLLTALLCAATLGMVDVGSSLSWHPYDWDVSFERKLLAFTAGAIFNAANVLVVKGIQMCGLAVAFPLCVGTALVLGSILTHIMEASNNSNLVLLSLGVAIAFLAVCTTSVAHWLKDRGAAAPVSSPASSSSSSSGASSSDGEASDLQEQKGPSTVRKLGICLVGGVLLSTWSPLNARSQESFGEIGLSPYGAFFAFSLGIAASTLLLMPAVLACPLDKAAPVSLVRVGKELKSRHFTVHIYGLLGGAVWAVGTLANSVSGQRLSFTASYAIGQSAPMVAMAWGVFHFHEFDGAPLKVKLLLAVVFLLYVLSIAFIALSHGG